MTHSIQNAFLTVSVDEDGAQLCSIVKDGEEYLSAAEESDDPHERDLGRLISGSHLELEHQDDDSMTFCLHAGGGSGESGLKNFVYRISYVLSGCTVFVITEIENTGEKLLEFYLDENPGLHYHIRHGIIEDPEDHDEDVAIESGEIYTLRWSVTVA